MKKNQLIALCFFIFSFAGTVNAQEPIYQLPNGGFENGWYQETSNANSAVPVGYNSFYSATGGYAGLASDKRCEISTDVRPGTTGIYSIRLFSTSVIGIRANGNVTTGRINAGSMTANNVENYNYTDYTPTTQTTPPNPIKFCPEITGTPDSLRFWVKYLPGRSGATNTTDKGRVRVYVHGTGPCRDTPIYPTGWTEQQYCYGKAMSEFYKEDGQWHCYQVPFVYNGSNIQKNANGNYYLLLSMTTNATPGGGANNADQMWVDDIEFIYSAWLTDLKVNGVTIDGFNKTLLTYGGPKLTCPAGEYCPFPYPESAFSWTPEVNDIQSVVVTNVPGPSDDADGGHTSILVTAEDGVTTKEYRIYYFSDRSDNNNITAMSYSMDGTTPIPITPFSPSQINYTIPPFGPEETQIPQIVESSIVLSDPATAEIQRIEQPTGVNSKGMVVVRAENLALKSYNVFFTKTVSTNNELNWIKIGGVDVPDFDTDTLTYNYLITGCTTTFPTITYEKASAYANVLYVPATLATKKATITVTAENGDQRIYTVNFNFNNDNTVLLGYRINTTNRNNTFSAANNYTDTYSASFSAAFTLSLSSTASQQGCTGSSVVFPSPTVWFPDTNMINVTAMNGINQQTYKVVVKNTNCYLTTGAGNGIKYKYNGVTYSTINITSSNNNNTNTVNYNVTLPIGPNEPAELIDANPIAPVVDTIIYTQPAGRVGMGSVKVVANDGTANKTYTVTFSATLSSDATLKYITYDGINVPGFNPATENYMLIFPSTATEVPELDFAPTFQWLPEENIDYTPAATLSDTAYIVVTAENGATKTYKIAFKVVPQEEDAYLIDIKYNNVSIPGFNPTITYYIVDVPYSDPTPPQTTPFASSPTALVFGDVQLNTPPYTKKYLVYSENMEVTELYTLDFNRIKNINPYLADIQINGVSLLNFDSEEFDYDYVLPYTEFNVPVVTATPVHPFADVMITNIDTIMGLVTIHVTAEDDAFTSTYTIDFTRELSPITNIETLTYTYNDEDYSYQFVGNNTEVTISLPVETLGEPEITEIVLADHRATVEIEEQPDETNDLTGTITVTAENLDEATYTVTFQRTLSSSTLITGITYNGIPVPDFHPDTLTYHVILPFNNSTNPVVAATAGWVNTVIQYNQINTPFGTATITVISEDENYSIGYTIVFERKGNCQLASLEYMLDDESIAVPNFSPTTYVYNVVLPMATTETPTVVYFPEDSRCDITEEQPDSPNGTFWVTLVTWNEDDVATYTVNFTVELSTEALLSDLQIDGITIENFNQNIFNYDIEYKYGEQPLPIPVITAIATEIDATVVVNDIDDYPGAATVTVTAGNPNYTNTYTVNFSVEAGDNNYLEDLLIGGVQWWEFDKEKYFYTVTLPHGTTPDDFPDVEGIPADERATVTHEADENLVNITVTAINGDSREYQVLFIVRGNSNAFASMIYIDSEPLPDFDKYEKNYTYPLPINYSGIPWVTAEKEDINAHGPDINYLSSFPEQVTVAIVAEDGETEMIYTITFERNNSLISFDNEAKIQVYPNPTSNYINFVIDELQAVTLEIYTVEGKKTSNYLLNAGVNTVNVETLPNGLYFYKIVSEQTLLYAGKFIKN